MEMDKKNEVKNESKNEPKEPEKLEENEPEELEEQENELEEELEEDELDDPEEESEEEPKGKDESKVKEIVMNSNKLRGWKFIKYISYTTGLKYEEAKRAYNAVFLSIMKALENDKIVFTPIGKIETAKLRSRKAVAFGKNVSLPDRLTVKLRVNGKFKKHLNEIKQH
jgi:nucleoid DNA-binding protein